MSSSVISTVISHVNQFVATVRSAEHDALTDRTADAEPFPDQYLIDPTSNASGENSDEASKLTAEVFSVSPFCPQHPRSAAGAAVTKEKIPAEALKLILNRHGVPLPASSDSAKKTSTSAAAGQNDDDAEARAENARKNRAHEQSLLESALVRPVLRSGDFAIDVSLGSPPDVTSTTTKKSVSAAAKTLPSAALAMGTAGIVATKEGLAAMCPPSAGWVVPASMSSKIVSGKSGESSSTSTTDDAIEREAATAALSSCLGVSIDEFAAELSQSQRSANVDESAKTEMAASIGAAELGALLLSIGSHLPADGLSLKTLVGTQAGKDAIRSVFALRSASDSVATAAQFPALLTALKTWLSDAATDAQSPAVADDKAKNANTPDDVTVAVSITPIQLALTAATQAERTTPMSEAEKKKADATLEELRCHTEPWRVDFALPPGVRAVRCADGRVSIGGCASKHGEELAIARAAAPPAVVAKGNAQGLPIATVPVPSALNTQCTPTLTGGSANVVSIFGAASPGRDLTTTTVTFSFSNGTGAEQSSKVPAAASVAPSESFGNVKVAAATAAVHAACDHARRILTAPATTATSTSSTSTDNEKPPKATEGSESAEGAKDETSAAAQSTNARPAVQSLLLRHGLRATSSAELSDRQIAAAAVLDGTDARLKSFFTMGRVGESWREVAQGVCAVVVACGGSAGDVNYLAQRWMLDWVSLLQGQMNAPVRAALIALCAFIVRDIECPKITAKKALPELRALLQTLSNGESDIAALKTDLARKTAAVSALADSITFALDAAKALGEFEEGVRSTTTDEKATDNNSASTSTICYCRDAAMLDVMSLCSAVLSTSHGRLLFTGASASAAARVFTAACDAVKYAVSIAGSSAAQAQGSNPRHFASPALAAVLSLFASVSNANSNASSVSSSSSSVTPRGLLSSLGPETVEALRVLSTALLSDVEKLVPVNDEASATKSDDTKKSLLTKATFDSDAKKTEPKAMRAATVAVQMSPLEVVANTLRCTDAGVQITSQTANGLLVDRAKQGTLTLRGCTPWSGGAGADAAEERKRQAPADASAEKTDAEIEADANTATSLSAVQYFEVSLPKGMPLVVPKPPRVKKSRAARRNNTTNADGTSTSETNTGTGNTGEGENTNATQGNNDDDDDDDDDRRTTGNNDDDDDDQPAPPGQRRKKKKKTEDPVDSVKIGVCSVAEDCTATGISECDTRRFIVPGGEIAAHGAARAGCEEHGFFNAIASAEIARVKVPTFGGGDTVGCGVDQDTSTAFFTLNGRLVASHLPLTVKNVTPFVFTNTTDKCSFNVNFGTAPFVFDVHSFAFRAAYRPKPGALCGGAVRSLKTNALALSFLAEAWTLPSAADHCRAALASFFAKSKKSASDSASKKDTTSSAAAAGSGDGAGQSASVEVFRVATQSALATLSTDDAWALFSDLLPKCEPKSEAQSICLYAMRTLQSRATATAKMKHQRLVEDAEEAAYMAYDEAQESESAKPSEPCVPVFTAPVLPLSAEQEAALFSTLTLGNASNSSPAKSDDQKSLGKNAAASNANDATTAPFQPAWASSTRHGVRLDGGVITLGQKQMLAHAVGTPIPRTGTTSFTILISRPNLMRPPRQLAEYGQFYVGVTTADEAEEFFDPAWLNTSTGDRPPTVWALHSIAQSQLGHIASSEVETASFIFAAGSQVTVTVDCDQGTMSFTRGATTWTRVFTNLPTNATLRPFVQIVDEFTNATILPGQTTAFVSPWSSARSAAAALVRARMDTVGGEEVDARSRAVAEKVWSALDPSSSPSSSSVKKNDTAAEMSAGNTAATAGVLELLGVGSDSAAATVGDVAFVTGDVAWISLKSETNADEASPGAAISSANSAPQDNTRTSSVIFGGEGTPAQSNLGGDEEIEGDDLSNQREATAALVPMRTAGIVLDGRPASAPTFSAGLAWIAERAATTASSFLSSTVVLSTAASAEAEGRSAIEDEAAVAWASLLASTRRATSFETVAEKNSLMRSSLIQPLLPQKTFVFSSIEGSATVPDHYGGALMVTSPSAGVTGAMGIATRPVAGTGVTQFSVRLSADWQGFIPTAAWSIPFKGECYIGVCTRSAAGVIGSRRNGLVTTPDMWAIPFSDTKESHLPHGCTMPMNYKLVNSGDTVRVRIDRRKKTLEVFKTRAMAVAETPLGVFFDNVPADVELFPFVFLTSPVASALFLPESGGLTRRTIAAPEHIARLKTRQAHMCDGCVQSLVDNAIRAPEWYRCNSCGDYDLCPSCFGSHIHAGHTFTHMRHDSFVPSVVTKSCKVERNMTVELPHLPVSLIATENVKTDDQWQATVTACAPSSNSSSPSEPKSTASCGAAWGVLRRETGTVDVPVTLSGLGHQGHHGGNVCVGVAAMSDLPHTMLGAKTATASSSSLSDSMIAAIHRGSAVGIGWQCPAAPAGAWTPWLNDRTRVVNSEGVSAGAATAPSTAELLTDDTIVVSFGEGGSVTMALNGVVAWRVEKRTWDVDTPLCIFVLFQRPRGTASVSPLGGDSSVQGQIAEISQASGLVRVVCGNAARWCTKEELRVPLAVAESTNALSVGGSAFASRRKGEPLRAVTIRAVPSGLEPVELIDSRSGDVFSLPLGHFFVAADLHAANTKAATDVVTLTPFDQAKLRMRRFYNKYAPEKTEAEMDKAITTFMKQQGGLEKMFEMLIKKYGPEPKEVAVDESSLLSGPKPTASEEEQIGKMQSADADGLRGVACVAILRLLLSAENSASASSSASPSSNHASGGVNERSVAESLRAAIPKATLLGLAESLVAFCGAAGPRALDALQASNATPALLASARGWSSMLSTAGSDVRSSTHVRGIARQWANLAHESDMIAAKTTGDRSDASTSQLLKADPSLWARGVRTGELILPMVSAMATTAEASAPKSSVLFNGLPATVLRGILDRDSQVFVDASLDLDQKTFTVGSVVTGAATSGTASTAGSSKNAAKEDETAVAVFPIVALTVDGTTRRVIADITMPSSSAPNPNPSENEKNSAARDVLRLFSSGAPHGRSGVPPAAAQCGVIARVTLTVSTDGGVEGDVSFSTGHHADLRLCASLCASTQSSSDSKPQQAVVVSSTTSNLSADLTATVAGRSLASVVFPDVNAEVDDEDITEQRRETQSGQAQLFFTVREALGLHAALLAADACPAPGPLPQLLLFAAASSARQSSASKSNGTSSSSSAAVVFDGEDEDAAKHFMHSVGARRGAAASFTALRDFCLRAPFFSTIPSAGAESGVEGKDSGSDLPAALYVLIARALAAAAPSWLSVPLTPSSSSGTSSASAPASAETTDEAQADVATAAVAAAVACVHRSLRFPAAMRALQRLLSESPALARGSSNRGGAIHATSSAGAAGNELEVPVGRLTAPLRATLSELFVEGCRSRALGIALASLAQFPSCHDVSPDDDGQKIGTTTSNTATTTSGVTSTKSDMMRLTWVSDPTAHTAAALATLPLAPVAALEHIAESARTGAAMPLAATPISASSSTTERESQRNDDENDSQKETMQRETVTWRALTEKTNVAGQRLLSGSVVGEGISLRTAAATNSDEKNDAVSKYFEVTVPTGASVGLGWALSSRFVAPAADAEEGSTADAEAAQEKARQAFERSVVKFGLDATSVIFDGASVFINGDWVKYGWADMSCAKVLGCGYNADNHSAIWFCDGEAFGEFTLPAEWRGLKELSPIVRCSASADGATIRASNTACLSMPIGFECLERTSAPLAGPTANLWTPSNVPPKSLTDYARIAKKMDAIATAASTKGKSVHVDPKKSTTASDSKEATTTASGTSKAPPAALTEEEQQYALHIDTAARCWQAVHDLIDPATSAAARADVRAATPSASSSPSRAPGSAGEESADAISGGEANAASEQKTIVVGNGLLETLKHMVPRSFRRSTVAIVKPVETRVDRRSLKHVTVQWFKLFSPDARTPNEALSNTLLHQLYQQVGSKGARFFEQTPMFYAALQIADNGHTPIDAGGPYNQVWSLLAEEIMGSEKQNFHKSPLFKSISTDKGQFLVPDESRTSALAVKLFRFFGQIMGHMLRAKSPLALELSPFVWKYLAGDTLTAEDFYEHIQAFWRDYVTDDDLLSDPAEVKEYFPNLDKHIDALVRRSPTYARLGRAALRRTAAEQCLVSRYDLQLSALREGLWDVAGERVCRSLLWSELEHSVCGEPHPTFEQFQESVSCNLPKAIADIFWAAAKQMTPDEWSKFFFFATGQKRYPLSRRIGVNPSGQSAAHLPTAATCFATVSVPPYASVEEMLRKLRQCIKHEEMEQA